MAEVPPGPSALSSSPADALPLPVDGCPLRGNNERLERGLGEALIPQPSAVKPKQNNIHTNSSLTQLNGVGEHTEEEEEEEEEEEPCSRRRVPVHNHVPHPALRDHQLTNSSDHPSCATQNNGALTAHSGVDTPENTATTPCSAAANRRTVGNCSSKETGVKCPETATEDGPAGPGCPEEQAPLEQMEKLSLNEQHSSDSAISYVRYESELQMPDIIRLITKDLSEPYSIYTYRYFIHNWPQLCFLAMVERNCVGAIVCKLDMHKKMFRRGYIAMLAVDSKFRRKGIGTNLVKKAIYAMVDGDCDEVVLETEITNKSALKLYENLGFVRDKRLFRYYLNGVDALRLKLWLR
ncbi:N-alpha-acetyltransferase 30 [Hoplias malabaricus]|uniref:N-alpha-acetyltransferase 30 n=1 Tax=Hoplias malabaricus TaxID=27720 RepID=UPI003462FEA5